METFVFLVAAAMCLVGAFGVVLMRNPVHNALSLVLTLFGVAVLFVNQEAHFLAAVQVIVYAGAIVVLFLFVIMLLGVDQSEDVSIEPIAGQRVIAVVLGAATFALAVVMLVVASDGPTGLPGAVAPVDEGVDNLRQLARVLFTDYVYAFELTAVLLTIAVVGAVVLARRGTTDAGQPSDEAPDERRSNETVAR